MTGPSLRRAGRSLGAGVLLAALALPVPAAGQRRPTPREALEALELQLDQAVSRVSRPAPGIVLGRVESARGYQIPGYGTVVVLTPRALPREEGVLLFRQRIGPAGSAEIRIETRVGSGRVKEDVARHLAEQARQALERERAGQAEDIIPPVEDPEADQLVALEQQVLEFQRQAEEERQMAERALERLARDVRVRLAAPPEAPRSVATAAGGPAGPVVPPAAAADPPPPGSPPGPPVVEAPLPPPPPWRFWFEGGGDHDARPPDRVMADVRSAVIATLEQAVPGLEALRAGEHVAVAVDFVPVGVFVSGARPSRTVVIRARRDDLEARRAGRLSPEELRRRIEVSEY